MINNNSEDIMVSVICLAYNHESFIRKALDGFVMQKTSFRYEVIVHEDASTDHTAQIIKEYEEKYPEIIKPIYQTENQYSKHIGIIKNFVLPVLHGKYIALCEGDDYWTDENKLQTQVEILESNPDCVACISQVEVVDLTGESIHQCIPENGIPEGVMNGDDYINYCIFPSYSRILPFQLSGFMITRTVYGEYLNNIPSYRSAFKVGDLPLFLYIGMQGNVYYVKRICSAYRVGNSSSFVGLANANIEKLKKHQEIESNALLAFDEYTSGKYHNTIERSLKYRRFMIYKKEKNLKAMKQPEMKEFYHQLSIQRKFTLYLNCYLPKISSYLKMVRSKFIKADK